MTRHKGSLNTKSYKWKVIIYEDGDFKQGKFSTINEMNRVLGTNISNDLAWRILTKNKVDLNQSFKDKSFISKYQHIKLEKINEPRPAEILIS